MANFLARLISVMFHPLLMATYLFGILAFTVPSALSPIQTSGHLTFILLIFLISFVLPIINIGILKAFASITLPKGSGEIKEAAFMPFFAMLERKDRVVPFSTIAILYLIFTYILITHFRIGIHDNAMKLIFVIDALVVLSAVITFFYKISVHSIGVCGLLGIVIPFNKVAEENQLLLPTIMLIVLAGIVMSARLQLQAHKPREILVGAIVGLLTGFMGVTLLF